MVFDRRWAMLGVLGQCRRRAVLWKPEAWLDNESSAAYTGAHEAGRGEIYSLLQQRPVTHCQWRYVSGQIRTVAIEGVRHCLTRTVM